MPPTKPSENPPATDDDLLEEYLNAEADQDLVERQELDQVGRQALRRRLRKQGADAPTLAGGDLDATWDLIDEGDETIGGVNPTPDQDMVDEIGEGAGLTYQDDEPLNYAKVFERDQHRWELNPASAVEVEDEDDDDEEDDSLEDELDELALIDGAEDGEALEVVDVDDLDEDDDEQ
jgi:hypothetical protein